MKLRTASQSEGLGRASRAQLMVLLPLTIAALVGATGFFALSMSGQFYALTAPARGAWQGFAAGLGIQIALISLVSAALGLSIAIGITRPMRQMARQLDGIASGDLRAGVEIRSISELDSLASAFNAAVETVNRYLLHGMTGAVLTTNTEGVVMGASPAAEGILGYREDELLGKHLSDIFTAAKGSRAALAAIDMAVRRRQPVAIDDVDLVSKDGRMVRISVTASYLRRREQGSSGDSDVVGVLITVKDLSVVRRLRDRLRQADHLVALGTVTAGVAHELRNPLGSLRGLTELLGRDFAADDPKRRYVSTMLESIDRLNRLIEDLLLFSSPAPPTRHDVDVTALSREIAGLARHGLGTRQVRIDVRYSAHSAIVEGDRDRLAQVLTNIIGNAVEATPDHGVVTVAVETTAHDAILTVHNTGSYIPPDVQSELFVPFFTTKPTGTGLGLAIARQFVTTAGGRIEVLSDQTSGTTFSVELPLRRPLDDDDTAYLPHTPQSEATRA